MVMIVSLLFVSLFVLFGAFYPDKLSDFMQNALASTIHQFGWFYLLSMFGFLAFAFYLAFGRFGNIRLGGEDAEPEFSRTSWFAMLFAAGMGIGLVFWGVAEPLSHFASPPMGLAPETPEAARAGLRFTFFHWGLHPWASYCIVALALGFFQFNRKKPMLISSVFTPLLGRHAEGGVGKSIDIMAIIATSFGVATSLGFGTLQIASGLHRITGIDNSMALQVTIIIVAAICYLISSMSGLTRGIQFLSNANMILAVLLLFSVLVFGPTLFIFDSLTTTVGDYFNNLVSMSMRLTPFRKGTWVADWTLFYWAWWVTWAPFVGMFIARISYGRTIREFVTWVLFLPSFVSFVWFSTFGGSALHAAMFEHLPLVASVKADSSMVLFDLLESLPASALTSIIAITLVTVFFITSADSATFVLGMMSTRGHQNPPGKIKLAWGILIASIAIVLLMSGGLKGLQTTAIVAALPFMVIMGLMCISLFKELAKEALELRHDHQEKEHLLDELLRERREKEKS